MPHQLEERPRNGAYSTHGDRSITFMPITNNIHADRSNNIPGRSFFPLWETMIGMNVIDDFFSPLR